MIIVKDNTTSLPAELGEKCSAPTSAVKAAEPTVDVKVCKARAVSSV